MHRIILKILLILSDIPRFSLGKAYGRIAGEWPWVSLLFWEPSLSVASCG